MNNAEFLAMVDEFMPPPPFEDSKPHPTRMIGSIEGCTNPESAEMLADGETLVWGNCRLIVGAEWYRAGTGLLYLEGQAFISRGHLSATGDVGVDERHLVTGLTATLGSDVLRKGTSRFPVGTVFIAAGGKPWGDADWNGPLDATPHVLAFDPMTGEVRGKIPLWDGSDIARKYNGLDQPNGLALDSQGNLYVGDIPNSNPDPDPTAPPPVPPAVFRIPHEALDALAAEEPGAADAVQRVPMPGYVNGVTVSPVDDTCYAVSCNPITDPVNGGIYNLLPEHFAAGVQPEPLRRGLGPMDGITVTRRGTIIVDSPLWGMIHAFPTDGSHLIVEAEGWPVRMPADCNVVYPKFLGGDEPALLVPDITVAGDPGEGVIGILDLTGL